MIVGVICTKSDVQVCCQAQEAKTLAGIQWWCYVCHRYVLPDADHVFYDVPHEHLKTIERPEVEYMNRLVSLERLVLDIAKAVSALNAERIQRQVKEIEALYRKELEQGG